MNRDLESLISDLWYQHPRGVTTWSVCASPDCGSGARGGRQCRQCVQDELAKIVGRDLALEYAGAIQTIRRLEHRMEDSLS